MAGIRMTGMASGLPPNIVEQIMEAERIPVKTMETSKGKSEDKLKLVNELDNKVNDITKNLGELGGAKGFQDLKFISADPNVIGGTVDPQNYVPGTWQMEVVQLAQKPGAISNGFPDKDKTELGVGYLKFKTPEGTKSVYLSGKSNTLTGVAKAINSANVGVRATIVNDRKDKESPFRLLISGLSTGDDKQVEFPTVYLLDGDQDVYFEEAREAKNGIVKIDGFEIEVSDNTVNDLIPGVSLELKSAAPGKPINCTVKEDVDLVSGKVKSFVDSVNAVLGFIQNQNKLTEKSDTSRTLGGDSLLRTVESRLRNILQGSSFLQQQGIVRLSQLGIEFTKTGTLSFDQDKFKAAMSKDVVGVQNFLLGDGFSRGFIPQLKNEITALTNQSFGPLANRKRGLQQKIDQVNHQIENKERHLARREESLRRQFSKLEETMSKLQSQGAAFGAMAPTMGGQALGKGA